MIRLVCILTCLIFVTPCFAAKTLTKISTSQIGDTVVKIPGKNSGLLDKVIDSTGSVLDAVVETTIALNKSGALKTAAEGAALTIPMIAKRAIPALGTAAVLGYAADCAFDLVKAHGHDWLKDYPLLQQIFDDTFPKTDPTFATEPSANSNIQTPSGTNLGLSGDWQWVHDYTYDIIPGWKTTYEYLGMYNGAWYFWDKDINGYIYKVTDEPGYRGYAHYMRHFRCFCWPASSGNPAIPGTAPTTLTDEQAHKLGQAIVNAFNSNPGVKDAIGDLAVKHPEVVTTPTPITQQDINNWSTTNNYNTNQTYINNLTNLKNTYEGDSTWIDQEIAKAQAEQEKEQTKDAEDTFDPITSSPFDPAYNPGEFDIPARFTSFLQNVKSSGLFSFSSSFFNSIPGGGSPLYTVEAGHYGTHTIDLSQTMTVGLAVLKSILLACFGFLSIRAVIMKR